MPARLRAGVRARGRAVVRAGVGQVVLLRAYSLRRWFDAFVKHRATILNATPQLLRDVVHLDASRLDRLKDGLRVLIYTGDLFNQNQQLKGNIGSTKTSFLLHHFSKCSASSVLITT